MRSRNPACRGRRQKSHQIGDFVGAASLTSGTISAGNADLEPDSLWRLALTYERRFGAGSFTATARREWISDLVDQLPVVVDGTVYDAVGNIGSARRDVVESALKWPLDGLGAKGVVVTADLVARRGNLIAFVEVKTRKTAAELDFAIDQRRLARVAAAAEVLMPRYAGPGDDIRVDVILLAPGTPPRHIENAWIG